MKTTLLTPLILSFTLHTAVGQDWPQWRGPDANGVAPPIAATGAIAWKTDLPGRGSSTPITWNGNILLTSGVDGKDTVLRLDASGKEIWRTSLGAEREARHRTASGSNPSPITDGASVFAYFKSGTVAALDLNGNIRWSLNLQKKYGEDTLWWDLGTSPTLADNNLVIPVMQAGTCYVIALDKQTGDVSWKIDRTFELPEESDQAYTSPTVHGDPGNRRILVWGSDHVTAHAAADGETRWTRDGFNPDNKRMWRAIASAVASENILVVPYGRGKHLAGIQLDGSRKWQRLDLGTEVPTPAAIGNRVYILGDKGQVSCLDIRTGKTQWSHALPKGRGKFFSSPLLAGDQLFCVREDGILFIGHVQEDGFELLHEVELGEPVIASPIPFRGHLLVRGESSLMLIN